MTQRFWTPERVAHAERLWRQGVIAATVAEIIGCTRNAVIGKMRRIGAEQGQRAKPGISAKQGQRAKPVPVPVPVPLPAKPVAKRFIDIERRECRYIVSEIDAEVMMCAKRTVGPLSYCKDHALVCYQKRKEAVR